MNYLNNIGIEKNFYNSLNGFTAELEKLDPTEQYVGTALEGLDAYQRQLKRFDIKVSGRESDSINKFFQTTDSAALFPEYVQRAVRQGMTDGDILSKIVASETKINSLDYRTISADFPEDQKHAPIIAQGGAIPETTIKLKENLVKLAKRGRLISASYEAIKFQRLDIFTVAMKEIGSYISKEQLKDAVKVLIEGDGNQNAAQVVSVASKGKLSYDDLISLWNSFENYEMNTILVAPDVMVKLLSIEELRNPATGLNFQGTGKLATPLGAELIRSSAVPAGKIVALDRRFALEKVTAGDVQVDYDKLIDTQIEKAAVTAIAGFSKIIPDAVKVLSLS